MDNHKDSVSINSFEKQMTFMKKMGYQTVNFNELHIKFNKKKFIITFDDGYENIFLNALPILKKLGFSATCFIVINNIGQYNKWDTDCNTFKKIKLMNLDQINEWVLNGFDVGSHSMDHLDLTKLNYQEKIQ